MSTGEFDKPAIKAQLEAWIAEGKTMREFCRQEGMPSWRAIYDWMDSDPDFASRIARARDIGADAIAQECLAIADTTQEGVTIKVTDRGVEETRGDMLGHRKLQVETRLKLLSKWNPKKYGDKMLHGSDPDNPLPAPVQLNVPR